MTAENVHYLGCPRNNMLLTLRDIIERIEANDIDAIYVAATLKSGEFISAVSMEDESHVVTLIGVLDAAKHALNESIDNPTQMLDEDEDDGPG